METENAVNRENARKKGLNRTMQYGNSTKVSDLLMAVFRFKSYYVVWKLFASVLAPAVLAAFKSYYVVWKLSFDHAHHLHNAV